jgi:hypothetical protein
MFIGTSDSTACQTLVAKAMNFSTELPGGNAIEYSPPNAKGRFYVSLIFINQFYGFLFLRGFPISII